MPRKLKPFSDLSRSGRYYRLQQLEKKALAIEARQAPPIPPPVAPSVLVPPDPGSPSSDKLGYDSFKLSSNIPLDRASIKDKAGDIRRQLEQLKADGKRYAHPVFKGTPDPSAPPTRGSKRRGHGSGAYSRIDDLLDDLNSDPNAFVNDLLQDSSDYDQLAGWGGAETLV